MPHFTIKTKYIYCHDTYFQNNGHHNQNNFECSEIIMGVVAPQDPSQMGGIGHHQSHIRADLGIGFSPAIFAES